MTIWHSSINIEQLNDSAKGNAIQNLGIEVTAFGDDWLEARMPVDNRTTQPQGLLHGGASVLLAETLGSWACYLTLDTAKYFCVGQEINANHLRSVRAGFVTGRATPIYQGRTSQVWEIRITEEGGKLVCISRITLAVVGRA
ncbi:MAG: hotdog fold thioesterase [Pseudomonadota bacterium]